MRRLTQEEYRNSIADIFGKEIEVQGVFEPTIRVGGLLAASTAVLSVTPAGFESFSKMADSIAVQVTAEKHRAKLSLRAQDPPRRPMMPAPARFFSHYGLMLFRRPLTDGRAQEPGEAGPQPWPRRRSDFYAGLRYGLAELLQSPDFLFRKEVAVPAADKDYTLDPYSRATPPELSDVGHHAGRRTAAGGREAAS